MTYEVFDERGRHLGDRLSGWNERKLRVLFLYCFDELKFQIGNIAYAQGDAANRVNGYGKEIVNEHMLHQWMDVVQDGNIEWVKNTIALAVSRVEHIVYNWTWHKMCADISLDNMPKPKFEYVIELNVNEGFSDVTATYLLHAIQRFIVATVLDEWASLTYVNGQPAWSKMVQDAAADIQRAFKMTNEPARIQPSWC